MPSAGESKTLRAYWWRGERPNFGDELAPVLIERLLGVTAERATSGPRLLTVGSIVTHSRPGDVLWGSGIHTTRDAGNWSAHDKTFLAVRGPLTRDFILRRGGRCPPIYGDPALLLPQIHPLTPRVKRELALFPHLDDDTGWNFGHARGIFTINASWPWERIVAEIVASAHVVSSSLHGLIVAEAYGVPATWARFVTRGGKFEDYFQGVGRTAPDPLPWAQAIERQPPAIQQAPPRELLPALRESFAESAEKLRTN
jgi:pyruvyltransferase